MARRWTLGPRENRISASFGLYNSTGIFGVADIDLVPRTNVVGSVSFWCSRQRISEAVEAKIKLEDTVIAPVSNFGETSITRDFEKIRGQWIKARAEDVERTREEEGRRLMAATARSIISAGHRRVTVTVSTWPTRLPSCHRVRCGPIRGVHNTQ